MEHPCEKCGAVVEEGTPFCGQCGAPQIRVRVLASRAEGRQQLGGVLEAGALPEPGQETLPPPRFHPGGQSSALSWRDAWRSAVLAGFFLTVAMAVPNAMPVLWFIMATVIAGGLAVILYIRRTRQPLTLARGARVGMMGGLAGWVAWVTVIALMIALGGPKLVSSLRDAVQKVVANSDPRAQQIFASPGMLASLIVFSMLFLLVLVLACSALGGMIGARLFGKKD